MPNLKRNVSRAEDRTPVGVYDGPLVPDGTYAAVIRSIKHRAASTGTEYLNVLAVLDAHNKDGVHAEYDNFNAWTKIWLDGSDFSESRELALYKAVAGKGDVVVTLDDKVQGDPIVTKIGGVDPKGVRVYVELRTEEYQGESRQNGFFIYPDPKANGQKATAAEPEADEPDEELDVEAEVKPAPAKRAAKKAPAKKSAPLAAVPDPEPEAEAVDYGAMTLPAVKKAARDAGINTEGKNRKDLIADLERVAGGGGENDQLNPQDIHNMDEEALIEFLDERYEEGDFIDEGELMSRADIVKVLVEDKHIKPF